MANKGTSEVNMGLGIDFNIDIKGIIFPRRRPICDKILEFNGKLICEKCRNKLVYINEPRCKKCGKQLIKMEDEYCYDCKMKKHLYKEGVVPFMHIGEIKKSIYKIKYCNKREYIDFYADEVVNRYGGIIKNWNCDALIPVPLHRQRRLKRGYNQAEIIADKCSKRLGIPVRKGILLRTKNTKPQKELNDMDRKKNLENAFKIGKNVVRLSKVILIDDIYTTGSTIDACAAVLLRSGIEEVYYVALSIGTGY